MQMKLKLSLVSILYEKSHTNKPQVTFHQKESLKYFHPLQNISDL